MHLQQKQVQDLGEMVSPNANTTAAAEGLRQLGGPLERRLPLHTLSLRPLPAERDFLQL